MIQYDFDARFWDPIAAGTKRATLRRMRTRPQRHARVGEAVECWAPHNGYRCMIRRAECASVDGVFMELARDLFALGDITRNRSTWPQLDLGGREGLARLTGHPGGWAEARACYAKRYGWAPITCCLISWRDPEYAGPIPSRQQLRDLAVLSQNKAVIPRYGKINTVVGHSLVVLGWAEVTDRTATLDTTGSEPIRITELGRWILERFEK